MARNEIRFRQVALLLLCCTALLFALRFDARTYPGWYFPNSPLLNGLLNGSTIFTDIGYALVLVGGGAGTARLLNSDPSLRRGAIRGLAALQWLALTLAVLIFFYGLWWAIQMERLPWQSQ
jgi:hypothetical protein